MGEQDGSPGQRNQTQCVQYLPPIPPLICILLLIVLFPRYHLANFVNLLGCRLRAEGYKGTFARREPVALNPMLILILTLTLTLTPTQTLLCFRLQGRTRTPSTTALAGQSSGVTMVEHPHPPPPSQAAKMRRAIRSWKMMATLMMRRMVKARWSFLDRILHSRMLFWIHEAARVETWPYMRSHSTLLGCLVL
jgi:hypothetical protein